MAAAKNLVQFMKAFELLSRPGGISIAELQEELGLSRRSVYRLFESMEELGYPLTEDFRDGKTKAWSLMPEYVASRPSGRVPRLSLNTGETMMLYQLLSRQTPLQVSGMKKTIEALKTRLEQFYLENSSSEELRRFKDLFLSLPGRYKMLEGKEDIYTTLLKAALEQRFCRGSYHSFRAGRLEEMDFLPLYFFEWNYGLYCFILRRRDEAIRTMAVERFETARLTDRPCRNIPDFDPLKQLGEAWALTSGEPLEIAVRFSEKAAPYIKEREWKPNQRIALESDGSLILRLSASGRRDIKSWILSFGADAEVLEPEDLREEIRADLLALSGRYGL